ncbi:hypothetical protein LTR86_007822 [Recurvomyces mirabilis]|nr:hypothetical protein LTR86_007822 [Recurvomyces mirabilis]
MLLAATASVATAQSTFKPLRPPALPLAVRSPYMNTWQQAGSDGGNGGYLAGEWPTFWAGQITGWSGFIRVDNVSYTWFGAADQNNLYADQTGYEYTSTKSIFTMNAAGLVDMTITFTSPVVPDDLLRASLPYTHMNVDVKSADGQQHNVQLYTDITAEWVSGDRSATAQWDYDVIQGASQPKANTPTTTQAPTTTFPDGPFGTETIYKGVDGVDHPFRPSQVSSNPHFRPTNFFPPGSAHPTGSANEHHKRQASGGIAYHEVYRQQQLNFSETNQQADWGQWYYATANVAGLTHQSGSDVNVRNQFLNNGVLANTEDTNYRAISDAYPVFGYAISLGQIGTSTVSTLFQLSLHQHDCIQFEGASGNQSLPCMWTSYFDTNTAAVDFFYNDYAKGSSLASIFDDKVKSDSVAAGGDDYSALTALAARQAFGALEFTNTPDAPYVFLKEISSDGNIQTVDVIFPFHPMAIYLNPSMLKYMLDPLFINQEAGFWPYAFSIHDLGTSFPNATGHNDGNAEQQPLEECGNMIIMTLAYAQRTNDNAYLSQHYGILKQWVEYLVEEALIPDSQISTDDFAGALVNQTNLALKGIIGIEAMAQIANRTGHPDDGANYTAIAHNYICQWEKLGVNYNTTYPRATLNYGNLTSHGLLYNLYADTELGLGLVPRNIYDIQSNFYPTVFNQYGPPLDTRHTYTKADWELWCAAIASTSTMTQFIDTVAKWLNETPTNFAFTDWYETITGDYPSAGMFIARPAVGGMYSLLALEGAPTSGYVTPS